MKYNLPDRVLRELSSFAQKYSVTKIILFGSRARGTNTERSDIDIAVYGGNFDGFYWDVKEKINSLLTSFIKYLISLKLYIFIFGISGRYCLKNCLLENLDCYLHFVLYSICIHIASPIWAIQNIPAILNQCTFRYHSV